MDFLNDPKYDGFPKPGPSFNPLKFISMENYRLYTQTEQARKAAAKDPKKAKGQEVPYLHMTPVKKTEKDVESLTVKPIKDEGVDTKTAVASNTERAHHGHAIIKQEKDKVEHIDALPRIEVAKGEPATAKLKNQKKCTTATHGIRITEDNHMIARKIDQENSNKGKALDEFSGSKPSFNPPKALPLGKFAHQSLPALADRNEAVPKNSVNPGNKRLGLFVAPVEKDWEGGGLLHDGEGSRCHDKHRHTERA